MKRESNYFAHLFANLAQRNCLPCTFLGLVAIFLVLSTCAPNRVSAAMIIDPSLGTVLTDGSHGPGDFVLDLPFAEPFGGRFFGNAVSLPVYASDNGNLNFSGDKSFWSNANNSVARISPFWDDFLFSQDDSFSLPNRINAFHNPGAFLAVSWVKAHLELETIAGDSFPGTDRSFQMLWMESDASIRGFDFHRDDIAFSYNGHVAGTPNFGSEVYARVALDDGGGEAGKTAILPGSMNGQISLESGNLLPWRNDEFLLFRWNSSVNHYDVSIESFTAVPEPSSLVLLMGVAVTAGVGKIRKRYLANRERAA